MDKRMLRLLLQVTAILSALVFAPACTVIKISDPEGDVRVEHRFGVVKILVEPSHGTSVTDVRSLGFVSTPSGATLGYRSERLAVSADDCVLIIWAESADALNPYAEFLEDPSICTAFQEEDGQ